MTKYEQDSRNLNDKVDKIKKVLEESSSESMDGL